MRGQKGVSLVEILIGILIVVIASIGTLSYFAYGMGNIGKQGNRRAALERARQRLEQLLSTGSIGLAPQDGATYWCADGNPCTAWTACGDESEGIACPVPISQTINVDDLQDQRIETTAEFINDPSTETEAFDTYELAVKVWFMPGPRVDDNFHRVHIRTLRTP